MERWSALMPDRHPAPPTTTHNGPLLGRLPVEAWIVVMHFLPVPDLPQLALTNSKLAHLVKDDRVWRCKLDWLDYTGPGAVDYRNHRRSSPPAPPPPPPQPYRDSSNQDDQDDQDGFGEFLDIRDQQQHDDDGDDDDDDGFGAFQDGDFSASSFAPAGGGGHHPASAATADDDLLLLFDDVELSQVGSSSSPPLAASSSSTGAGFASGSGGSGATNEPPFSPSLQQQQPQPPRRPPAVSSNLTFATRPVKPLSAATTTTTTTTTTTPRSSSSSSEHRQKKKKQEEEVHQQQRQQQGGEGIGGGGGGSGGSPALLRVYQQHVSLLLPFYTSLQTQSTSSLVFTPTTFTTTTTPSTSAPESITMTPLLRARLLASLNRFCHPLVAPTRSRTQRLLVARNVQSAIDFYESTLLAEFERADTDAGGAKGGAKGGGALKGATGRDEATMKDKANVLWELNQSTTLSQVFVQKRETLFASTLSPGGGGGGGTSSHDPLKNLTKIETPSGALADGIDFSALDRFMTSILSILTREGSLIARVFPPRAEVLLYFLERVANDVVSEYITSLLAATQPLRKPLFLLATAATFGQVYRLVDCVLEIRAEDPSSSPSPADSEEPTRLAAVEGGGGSPPPPLVTKERAEDVVFRMFEPLMDDYLAEEGEWIRQVLEGICDEWDRKTAHDLAVSDPTFLASQNPAQVKRNVLAGFTKVLLLPVTIIPKTAEFGLNAITYGATGVIDTFASLGNQFSSNAAGGGGSGDTATTKQKVLSSSAVHASSLDSVAGHQQQQQPPSREEGSTETTTPSALATVPIESSASAWGGDDAAFTSAPHRRLSVDANGNIGLMESQTDSAAAAPRRSTVPPAVPGRFDRLQLLLSLDTALQLIQADRDSLKRIQTFIRYPGVYGRKVRDAIEEVFLVLLRILSEKHVCPAFAQATQQMAAYQPSEHEDVVAVAPLVQFFELVHIGDTIQQMVDVYFEKEMAAYIDRRDFLNAVVREKKKFESALDDAVAQGLNAAVNILMVSVEHLITTRQGLRDFTPDRDDDFDLTPTRACVEAIETLKHHCDMLRGSTDKQILEVFNQEVGIRLHGILLKHLKRQIVSTQGGLRLIADLNAYHSFVSTLRQPQVTAYFTSLKMVGELFLIDDPKELGALVRDTSRYEGTLSQEDLYELVQRRADWQKIERLVDKAVYGLECLVC